MNIKKVILDFSLAFIGIISICSLPSLILTEDGTIGLNPYQFGYTLMDILSGFLHAKNLTITIHSHTYHMFPDVLNSYIYTLKLLGLTYITSFIFAILLVFIVLSLPARFKVGVKMVFSLLRSVPDVFFIFSLQLAVIWVYKKTDLLLVDPLAVFQDPVYIFPIFALSILPTIFLFQISLSSFEEELNKPYVEFARGKGMKRIYINFRHVFQNTIISIFNYSKQLFWFMLSNLLMLEYMFNINGFTQFFLNHYSPDIFAVCLTMLFVPFFLIFYIGEKFVLKLEKGGV